VRLVGVWQRNFEPVVYVHGTMGWELVSSPLYHAQHHRFKITLPNTDQAHKKYL